MRGWSSRAGIGRRSTTRAGISVIAIAPTSAVLQSQAMPLIEQTDTLRPIRRWSPKPGHLRLRPRPEHRRLGATSSAGTGGRHVQLRFAEILAPDSANITQINLRSAKATDRYVLNGRGVEKFAPHFTYHGFRYIEVTGYPGVPTADDITGIVVHTALPETGTLTTSDPSLNRLWQNVMWTQRANLYSVPTDCPQRDERMGWMGDAQVFLAHGELQHGHERVRREMADRRARWASRQRLLSRTSRRISSACSAVARRAGPMPA